MPVFFRGKKMVLLRGSKTKGLTCDEYPSLCYRSGIMIDDKFRRSAPLGLGREGNCCSPDSEVIDIVPRRNKNNMNKNRRRQRNLFAIKIL